MSRLSLNHTFYAYPLNFIGKSVFKFQIKKFLNLRNKKKKIKIKKKNMYLTEDELILVLVQALVKARKLRSGLPDATENDRPQIHVAIQGVRRQKEPVVVYSDEQAADEHKLLSQLKSSVAVKHSSDNLAMSSHAVGHQISLKKGVTPTFSHAGGVPLYKNGTLVGSVGISGDTPAVDEAIAHAAAEGLSAPSHIRSDSVLGVPFHSGEVVEEVSSVSQFARTPTTSRIPKTPRSESPATGSLPPLPSSVSMTTLPPLPLVSAPPTPSSLPPLTRNRSSTSLPRVPSTPVRAVTPSRNLPPSPVQISNGLSPSQARTPSRSLPASPLPPLKQGSSLSSLAPSGFQTTGVSTFKIPVLPPSPQQTRTTLPSLSTLTPLK